MIYAAVEGALADNDGERYPTHGALVGPLVISHRFEFDRLETVVHALEIA